MPVTSNRRGFLKLGLASSIGLTLTASLIGMSPHIQAKSPDDFAHLNFRFLDADSASFLAVLFPLVLNKKALDRDSQETLLIALDEVIDHFNAFNQKQLKQLFDLMGFAPTRFIAGAPWANWSEASAQEIEHFLIGWRDSRLALKRMGYLSICKLINLSWYANKATFAEVGYPGPPVKIPTPITQSL